MSDFVNKQPREETEEAEEERYQELRIKGLTGLDWTGRPGGAMEHQLTAIGPSSKRIAAAPGRKEEE